MGMREVHIMYVCVHAGFLCVLIKAPVKHAVAAYLIRDDV